MRKKEGEIVSVIQEVLSSIRVVKAFAREDYEQRRLEEESLEGVEIALRARGLKAKLAPLVEIIVAVGMIISAQMDLLGSLQNPKLQYLHGSTPDRLDRRKKAFSLPIPKIAVATYLKDLVEKEGNGEFLGVIHNGIDLGEYFPAVPESSRDGVGTIYGSHPVKDPKTVIGVLQGLSKLRPDVQLRVFSGDRRPRGISRSIYLRQPTVDQARDIYSRSQVWIMASESEGFSMPVLEAMACGCAVVATDCGGPKDQIVDGQNGFLVPVGDVEQIISRILLLLNNPDLRTRIQKNALETSRQFTWEKCVDALEATLGRLARQDDRHPTAPGNSRTRIFTGSTTRS